MDETVLGHLLRICISQHDPSVMQAFVGAERRSQKSVENSLDTYRSMLKSVTGLGHELFRTLLTKGGKSKEETVRPQNDRLPTLNHHTLVVVELTLRLPKKRNSLAAISCLRYPGLQRQ